MAIRWLNFFTLLEWGVLKKRKNNQDFRNNSPLYNSAIQYISNTLKNHKEEYFIDSQGAYTEVSSFADNPEGLFKQMA